MLTFLSHLPALQPAELRALHEIGERSFGICTRAGVFYQQAGELLADLRDQ
ncbi:MAG: hypothetical protein ABJB47_15465 [Actinomycetota bacterium]